MKRKRIVNNKKFQKVDLNSLIVGKGMSISISEIAHAPHTTPIIVIDKGESYENLMKVDTH